MNKAIFCFICLVYLQFRYGKINKKSVKSSASVFLETKHAISSIDDPKNFFNSDYEKNIRKLPKNGAAAKPIWSTWSWPAKFGYISVRYNLLKSNGIGDYDASAGNFSKIYNWEESISSYSQPKEYQSMKSNIEQLQKQIEDVYSPSEKYDILVGDYNFTLTNFLKDYVSNMGSDYPEIPEYIGASNGWAIAQVNYTKPLSTVTLTNPDGIKIVFLPDDVSAILSMYYSTLPSNNNFVGGICNAAPSSVNSDTSTGIYTDPNCAAVNPAILLLVLTNAFGKKLPVTMDPMVDAQVWNQPIMNYQYDYYNIINNQTQSDLQKAKVETSSLKNFNNNYFKFILKQVTSSTKSFVGIRWTIMFALQSFPFRAKTDTPDQNYTATYSGVVELDASDNVVGGEWTDNSHPNLLWKNDERYPGVGCCDNMTSDFTGQVSQSLKNAAIAASKQGQLLKTLVNYLATASAVKEAPPSSTITSGGYNNELPQPNYRRESRYDYVPISGVTLPGSENYGEDDDEESYPSSNSRSGSSSSSSSNNSNNSNNRPSSSSTNSSNNRPSSSSSSNGSNSRPSSSSSSNSSTNGRNNNVSSNNSRSNGSNSSNVSNGNTRSIYTNNNGRPNNNNSNSNSRSRTNSNYSARDLLDEIYSSFD